MYEITLILKDKSKCTFIAKTISSVVDLAIKTSAKYGWNLLDAYLNDKHLTLFNGAFYTDDNEPLCINEAWHETFAKPSEAILPTRIITNPATYEAKGEAL